MQQLCKQCGRNFSEKPEETAMRLRLIPVLKAGNLPAAKTCPDCRLQRKMAWRNERCLYRRQCDKSGKTMLSVYSPQTVFPVYERSEWWSDSWNALEYGQSFDFTRSFTQQFAELQKKVPRPSLNAQNSENSDYCNFLISCKDCYLCFSMYYSESSLYSYFLLKSRDAVDCAYCFEAERCYECTDCNHSYGCTHCVLAHNCTDSQYLYDCRGCTECFGCVGLRKKSWCLFNEQLTKDEYRKRLATLDLQDSAQQTVIDEQLAALKSNHPHLYSMQDKTEDCTGDCVFESRNCHEAFQVYRLDDCLYLQDADDIKSSLHAYHVGWSESLYDCYSASHLQSSAFFSQCWNGSDNFYCDNCHSCSNCFGCISLRSKKYCIFNKQYTKEEYEMLMPKIVDHMRSTNEWGEFFDLSLSPFAYDETIAQEYFPLTKEQALAKGFRWSGYASPLPEAKKVIPADQLPRTESIPDDILNWAIRCEVTGKLFKLTKQELTFYRSQKIPVPRRHPDQRHKDRMLLRNPRKLWKRECAKCSKPIDTTYAPDQKEIVCCEECYLKAVY